MKKLLSIFTFTTLLTLSSCKTNQIEPSNTNQIPSQTTNNNTTSSQTTTDETTTNPITINTKALVIYFSATSHTENVANTIANYINAPIHKLEPTNAYSSQDLNYSNRNSRVVQEYLITQNGSRVNTELTTTSFDEFESSTYIFLGAPVWWQQLSWVIENFVKDNDFSGKTIIPFGTSSSSSFNLNNLKPLTEDDTNVTWLDPQRFSSSVSSSTVTNWIDSLNLNLR